ncbi:MAG TPA: ABC transporter permease [Gemmatimonadales bacterium]|nr:ABC transporter permease [Gemmatimonadales bacterium]
MHKVWAVIRREFVERVRSKWFLVSTILGPVFMIAVTVLPSLLATRSGRVNHIVLVDEGSDSFAQRLRTQLAGSGRFTVELLESGEGQDTAVKDSLTNEVRTEALDGFLTVSSATLESGTAEYRGRNVSSLRDMAVMEGALRQSVVTERLTRRGVDPGVVQEAQRGIDLKTLRVTKRGATGESGMVTFFLGYGVGLVLYMIILIYGINVMRSVLEEKQTRIIEVLVSSLRPFQLMLGKVVGVGGVGLFQFGIWTFTGYLMLHFRAQILGAFHVPLEQISSFTFPAISGTLLAVVGAYFVLGYLLYAALFAVVGASVTADSEAQQAQQPVMMLLVFSLIVSFAALSDPSGQMAVVTSMIPVSSPIIMPVRVATSDVPTAQLALSLVIAAATVLLVVWLSARVYRIGILMYGKRPNLKELWRWARQD